VVLAFVRKRHRYLASDAARSTGHAQPWVPRVSEADLDHMVHSTAVLALERARKSAWRFDPKKSDGIGWVLGCAPFAWIDEARKAAPDPRRHGIPTDDEELAAADCHHGGDVADHAAAAVDLNDCLNRLPAEERQALILCCRYGLSYREAAEAMMGDPERAKRVDKLLQQARTRMDEMWEQTSSGL
jgi:DNA-directed RNA polymerase specialized sigma24 family protein